MRVYKAKNAVPFAVVPEVLATFKSAKNPGKIYKIIKGKDGVTYCECMQWRLKKHCKHLDLYNAKKHKKRMVVQADQDVDSFMRKKNIQSAVQNEIRKLTGR